MIAPQAGGGARAQRAAAVPTAATGTSPAPPPASLPVPSASLPLPPVVIVWLCSLLEIIPQPQGAHTTKRADQNSNRPCPGYIACFGQTANHNGVPSASLPLSRPFSSGPGRDPPAEPAGAVSFFRLWRPRSGREQSPSSVGSAGAAGGSSHVVQCRGV